MKSPEIYSVIKPTDIYLGKTYGNWVADWTNWFYSIEPDRHNNGPVVFLRSLPFTIPPGLTSGSEPMVMVGNDRLDISDDQAILVPVVTATYVATEQWNTNNTDLFLRGVVRSHLFGGDFPPKRDQLTINGNPVEVDLSQYLVETPLFTLLIPKTEYGKSLKDYAEEPLPSGAFHSVTSGFFLLLRLSEGSYIVHSYSRGLRTEQGEFYNELLYEIDVRVHEIAPTPPQTGMLPLSLTTKMLTRLNEKFEKGEISQDRLNDLSGIVKRSRETLKERIRDRGRPET